MGGEEMIEAALTFEGDKTVGDVLKSLSKNCPVKIGDRFYYNNSGVQNGTVIEDFIRVMEIKKLGSGDYAIRGMYENHLYGPHERWYSSKIFEDPHWVIKTRAS
jgi:hypothetical protein